MSLLKLLFESFGKLIAMIPMSGKLARKRKLRASSEHRQEKLFRLPKKRLMKIIYCRPSILQIATTKTLTRRETGHDTKFRSRNPDSCHRHSNGRGNL